MKKLFRKKPKSPLEEAACKVEEAVEIAYAYLRDRKHMPDEEELRQLSRLTEAVWHSHATLRHITGNMYKRSLGLPEGAKKFTDPAVFDYHYPP